MYKLLNKYINHYIHETSLKNRGYICLEFCNQSNDCDKSLYKCITLGFILINYV